MQKKTPYSATYHPDFEKTQSAYAQGTCLQRGPLEAGPWHQGETNAYCNLGQGSEYKDGGRAKRRPSPVNMEC